MVNAQPMLEFRNFTLKQLRIDLKMKYLLRRNFTIRNKNKTKENNFMLNFKEQAKAYLI